MKSSLGEFEILVLLAALRLGPGAYGMSIAEEIERNAGRAASRASVYVTLRRLEANGLIATKREPASSAPRGKPRRFVTVKPSALELIRDARRALERMWSGLDEVLEEA